MDRIEVYDMGNDVLRVRRYILVESEKEGEDSTEEVDKEFFGWVSALNQCPVDDSRDEDGHRLNNEMRDTTKEEKQAYINSLLAENEPILINLEG